MATERTPTTVGNVDWSDDSKSRAHWILGGGGSRDGRQDDGEDDLRGLVGGAAVGKHPGGRRGGFEEEVHLLGEG
jgi:hypothetical protein